ncbi:transmembrane protease serine 9-like [Chironomus tepperi]|uniref:transmembrane protease serine 9-like n=1 Tax=Chironomus tepperi TaxID=113505 RepID=UPI00391F3C88
MRFQQTCGKVLVGRPNIVGGKYAVHGAFPWVAVLVNNQGNPFCGATLLTKNKVLTAAHCMHGKDDTHEFLPRDITVIFGAHNLSKIYEQGKISVGVQSIDIHREWNTKSASYDADISVLTLTDDVAFSRFIQPICLMSSDSEMMRIKKGFTAGFGKSENDTNVLKSVEIPIANSNEECFYTNDALVQISSVRTFCGGSRGGAGVCVGDSGNGLFVEHLQTHYLRGHVSASLYSNTECDVNNHAIFTDVVKFNAWIVERIDMIDRPFMYGSTITQVTTPRTTTSRRPRVRTTTTTPSVSPTITPIHSPMEVTEGTNFELPCKAQGYPNPTVRWSSTSPVDANVAANGHTLIITNVSFRNSGKYVCEATNSAGKDAINVYLTVRSASSTGHVPWESPRSGSSSLSSVIPIKIPSRTTANVGSKHEFECKIDGNFQLNWRRANGQSLQSNAVNNNGLLVIYNVGHKDAGTYECVVTDSYGQSGAVLSIIMDVVGDEIRTSPNLGFFRTYN